MTPGNPPSTAMDDENAQAATLAAAVLRFQEPLAHLPSTSTPAGMPVVGVDAYVFLPSVRRVAGGRSWTCSRRV